MNSATDEDVSGAIDDIAYSTDSKTSWLILGHATDEQIAAAIGNLPSTHVVNLIRRLIERAYIK